MDKGSMSGKESTREAICSTFSQIPTRRCWIFEKSSIKMSSLSISGSRDSSGLPKDIQNEVEGIQFLSSITEIASTLEVNAGIAISGLIQKLAIVIK